MLSSKEIPAYLEACFSDRVRQNWLFVNVSRASPYYGKSRRVSSSTFSEAVNLYLESRRYGKVNKLVFSPNREQKFSLYISGGVVKYGRTVRPADVTVYLNDERLAIEPGVARRKARAGPPAPAGRRKAN